jgi:hypothetical protein
LHVGHLRSHLVRDKLKIVPEFYEKLAISSKSEVQHFCKLEHQRKTPKQDDAARSRYNDNKRNYPKPVHIIDSDGCEPPENWEKNFVPPP